MSIQENIFQKPYPIPSVYDAMQKLKGFQFLTVLYLNMGYYTIQIDAKPKDIMTIVTEFRKFQYNVLPMEMVISGDIFQTKVNELIENIEVVKSYIDDMLVINKVTFADQVGQLRTCSLRIQKSGLKINANKYSFGLKDIPYLV